MQKLHNLILSPLLAASVGVTTAFTGATAMAGPSEKFNQHSGNYRPHGLKFDFGAYPILNSNVAQIYVSRLNQYHPNMAGILYEMYENKLPDGGLSFEKQLKRGMLNPGEGFLVAFPASNGEMLHRFSDVPRSSNSADRYTGVTITVGREAINSREQFDKMKQEGTLSPHAPWVEGGGQYIVSAMRTEQRGPTDQRVFPISNPYRYLDPSLKKSEQALSLQNFDPRDVGLPLDPAEQVKSGATGANLVVNVRGLRIPHTTGTKPEGGFDPSGMDRQRQAPTTGGTTGDAIPQIDTGRLRRGAEQVQEGAQQGVDAVKGGLNKMGDWLKEQGKKAPPPSSGNEPSY